MHFVCAVPPHQCTIHYEIPARSPSLLLGAACTLGTAVAVVAALTVVGALGAGVCLLAACALWAASAVVAALAVVLAHGARHDEWEREDVIRPGVRTRVLGELD